MDTPIFIILRSRYIRPDHGDTCGLPENRKPWFELGTAAVKGAAAAAIKAVVVIEIIIKS